MYEKFTLKVAEGEELNGIRWNVPEPRCVMCVIHGIGEYAARYDRMAEMMKGMQISVYGMDLRGHGESFGRRGHCAPRDKVRRDVDALIQHVQTACPGAKIVLYGHSMGGNIALDYKKRGDLNDVPAAYIISAPWIELVRSVPGPVFLLVKTLSKLVPEMGLSSNVPPEKLGHPDLVGGYETDPLTHRQISVLCAAEAFEIGKNLARGAVADNGKAEDIPMLLMHGTEDHICSVEGSRKVAKLEQCEYIEWPGLYHEIHNGNLQSTGSEVIARMGQWILALLG